LVVDHGTSLGTKDQQKSNQIIKNQAKFTYYWLNLMLVNEGTFNCIVIDPKNIVILEVNKHCECPK